MSASVAVEGFRPCRRATLRGFAKVRFASGLVMDEIAVQVSQSGKAWAQPPAAPRLDADGNPIRDERGKVKYSPLIGFADLETRGRWSAQIIEALRQSHPRALEVESP
jgi:hypothetical protein